MKNIDLSNRLPFFEVEDNREDSRFGSIKAWHEKLGSMGVLDFFHGHSSDVQNVKEGRPAMFVTQLSLSKDVVSSSLERALLYIAACIADDAGEEVIFRRPPYAKPASEQGDKLWEILGVKKLLENYDAMVQHI